MSPNLQSLSDIRSTNMSPNLQRLKLSYIEEALSDCEPPSTIRAGLLWRNMLV